jgi:GNAT superfamily N-acetyltransferase
MAQVHQTIDARHYQADEVLRDGSIVQIRAIRPDDKERLLEHFAGLGARSRYFRFFGLKRALTSDDLVRFSELDFERHVGLAATIEQNGHQRFIGVGRYVRSRLPSHAEIAAAVSDEYQGIGIGPMLIRHLARIAHADGITQFEADVMGDNRRMLTILRNSGCITHHTSNAGVVHFTLRCPESPGLTVKSNKSDYADRLSGGPKGGSHG